MSHPCLSSPKMSVELCLAFTLMLIQSQVHCRFNAIFSFPFSSYGTGWCPLSQLYPASFKMFHKAW